jgi:DNA-directed RNA polymerase subunit F
LSRLFIQGKRESETYLGKKEESVMEVQDYCRNLHIELTGWKAKVYDIMRKFDRLDTGNKGKVVSEVNDLHIFVEELDNRISELERECPSEWSPAREEIQNKLQALGYKWEKTWQGVAGGDVGG